MRIAQLSSNLNPVETGSTKAICSHVAHLANAIAEAGHEAHLYAASESRTKAVLHAPAGPAGAMKGLPADIQRHYTNTVISECYRDAKDYDLVHSHFTLLSSFYANLVATPTLISVHSPIRDEIRPFLKYFRNLSYVSFSLAQRKQMPELNWVANIYHGVDTAKFGYCAVPKDYFLYLGRVTEEKGVHYAIDAAKAAGVPLIIAGGSYPAEGYWHKNIEPEINGKTVRYVGVADESQKIELLRGARALLFPTQYDETFGLVMAEAMACGTPVIGWRNGSVPEVIQEGETGYVVDSVEGMVKAIGAIDKIGRQATRRRAETFFSLEKMSQGYLRVYGRIIEKAKAKKVAKRASAKKK